MRRTDLVYIFLCFLLMSCDKEIEIKVPFEGEKLVISSLINPISPVTVSISKTAYPYQEIDVRSIYLQNATVTLLEDGISVGSFVYDTIVRKYVSEFVPKRGFGYQLIVDVPEYERVSSEVISIPEQMQIMVESTKPDSVGASDTINTANGTVIAFDFSSSSTIKINFTDPGSEENYYAYQTDVRFTGGGGGYGASLTGIYEEGCNFTNFGFFSGNIFDDYCFNGLETNIEIAIIYSGKPVFKVEFYSLDLNAYEYEKKLGLYQLSQFGTEFNLDPIRIPSSFDNAYGVFGAYNLSTATIELEEAY